MDGKSCKLPILFCAIILAIAACIGPASAATITIDNSSSIADALLNVGADGTVILEPGIYFISSQIEISNSSTIRASDGHGQGDTIIDAQSACRIFSDTGGHSLTIEDLTLRNGAVTDSNYGGAISCSPGDVTLTDTTITDCTARRGGAIYLNVGNITATSATFTDCSATSRGGGIYCDFGGNNVTLTNTTFTRCSGASMGGAIFSINNITATSTTFTGCSAKNGGAIFFNKQLIITSCTFTDCSASVDDLYSGGGAISSSGSSAVLDITSSTITNCTATSSAGGAIYSGYGRVTNITSSTITDCSAYYGGAIASKTSTFNTTTITNCSASSGGAIYVLEDGTFTINSSTITNCSANYGGAIFVLEDGTFTINSSTITNCSASSGGAIYVSREGTLTINSSTITGCSGSNGGAIYSVFDTNCSVHFSRIYDNTAKASGSTWYDFDGNVNATNNWWGSNDDPSASFYKGGDFYYSPWLVLGGVADPSTINLTGTSVIRANMTYDVSGNDTSGSGYLPDGILMAFAVTSSSGGVSPSSGTTTNGAASTTFTPSAAGNTTVNVTVDNETISVPLMVSLDPPVADFSASPLTGTPPLNVTFNDTSTGTVTAWNWSFGDGEWFNTTDSALKNATHTYSLTGNYTVNLTVSNSAGSNTSSKADYITVSTSPTPTTTPTPTPTPAPAPVRSSSGGGGSNTNTGTGFATSLKAGEKMTFEMDKGAVYLVSFTADKNIQKLIITVKRTVSVPSSIGAPDTEVYEYEDVTLYYTENSDLSNKTFEFKVKKSWLTEKGYIPGDIVMLHYNEEAGEWEELSTTFVREEGSYYYYNTETPSFSWFAIAVSEGATIVPESTAAPVTKAVTAVSTHSSSSVATPPSTVSAVSSGDTGSSGGAGSWTSLLMPVLVVILVIIVAAAIVVRKRKEKYPDWWDEKNLK